MLASRVAHASAKGRSPAIRTTEAIVGVCEARHAIFRTGSPKTALLGPVATCFTGERRVRDGLAHALQICSKESAGIFGTGS